MEDLNTLLRRPLYIYDLPPELLYSLSSRSGAGSVVHQETKLTSLIEAAPRVEADANAIAQTPSCNLCHAKYSNVEEQRQHVRSDHHKYNLKLNIRGLPIISESEFIKQIGDLAESISGSESSDSGDEEDGGKADDTLRILFKRKAKITPQEDEDKEVSSGKVAGNAPIIWFSSSKLEKSIGLGIYKSVFSDVEQREQTPKLIEILKQKQLKPVHSKHSGNTQGAPNLPSSDPHFFLCMIGGGHFAAAIISLVPELRRGPGGVEERHPIVRAHKTFHRYTTRRKQGGAQSASDAAKGAAHSVGSSLRRANEAQLEVDVRNVLSEWRNALDSAELIFVRATGSSNRRTLFGPYDGQVLNSKDKRLRGFPFSTRRATQAELVKAFQELTRLKISTIVDEPQKPKPEKEEPEQPKQKPTVLKVSKEEEEARLHTSQLQALIRRTKVPGVLLYLSKNGLDANYIFQPVEENHHASTPLHAAAAIHCAPLVLALMVKANGNPTIKNGDGKTPYDLAGEFRTRDSFRVARGTLGETTFDWTAAHVPTALSPEEAAARDREESVASNKAESERRKAALEQLSKEDESRKVNNIERKAGGGKSLGTAEKTGTEKREAEARGLTPEMRMKLERERRARAAEERLKKMQGPH